MMLRFAMKIPKVLLQPAPIYQGMGVRHLFQQQQDAIMALTLPQWITFGRFKRGEPYGGRDGMGVVRPNERIP